MKVGLHFLEVKKHTLVYPRSYRSVITSFRLTVIFPERGRVFQRIPGTYSNDVCLYRSFHDLIESPIDDESSIRGLKDRRSCDSCRDRSMIDSLLRGPPEKRWNMVFHGLKRRIFRDKPVWAPLCTEPSRWAGRSGFSLVNSDFHWFPLWFLIDEIIDSGRKRILFLGFHWTQTFRFTTLNKDYIVRRSSPLTLKRSIECYSKRSHCVVNRQRFTIILNSQLELRIRCGPPGPPVTQLVALVARWDLARLGWRSEGNGQSRVKPWTYGTRGVGLSMASFFAIEWQGPPERWVNTVLGWVPGRY